MATRTAPLRARWVLVTEASGKKHLEERWIPPRRRIAQERRPLVKADAKHAA